jgi:hypothetical protein
MPPGPGPSADAAEQLRQRATQLRTVAAKIEGTPALDLHRRAGDDVWRGPTPLRCLNDLLLMRADLLRAGDDLRGAARQLDDRAEQLDAAARAKAAATAAGLPPGLTPGLTPATGAG